MNDINEKNFGIFIAFLLPGFLFLWGLSFSSDVVSGWLVLHQREDSQTIAKFLFASMGSLAVGLLISAVRWLLIDHALQLFGVVDPGMNFKNLGDKEKRAGFLTVVENHYRYYQYYSNTLIAIVAAFVIYLFKGADWPSCGQWVGVAFISVTLFLGSKDSLGKYYLRGHDALN